MWPTPAHPMGPCRPSRPEPTLNAASTLALRRLPEGLDACAAKRRLPCGRLRCRRLPTVWSTALTPHQAFAVDRHALALQFHPEADPAHIEAGLIGHANEQGQAGIDIRALRAQTAALGAGTAVAAAALLACLLDGWADAAPSRADDTA